MIFPSAPKDAPNSNIPPTLTFLPSTSVLTALPCSMSAAIGPNSALEPLSKITTSGNLIVSNFSLTPGNANNLSSGLIPIT
jgi:hypothetical protein